MSATAVEAARGAAFTSESPAEWAEYAPMHVSHVWAIVGGVFLLRGRNWARWLLVAWMAAHLALGVLHSPLKLAVHVVMFGLITYYLFRRNAAAYLRGPRA